MALIVVVDDEFLLADYLASLLTDEGHEVVTAAHGRAGLQLIRERKPALVITDFMMPLMTGLELAQALAADAELADLPIILVTGGQGLIARDHGELFDEIFDKPYDQSLMIEAVQRLTAAPKTER
ncbi:MAG: response regulator [Rhodospirillales bacterium]|nr:response regulator [Rhodospirillales bacterium]MDE2319785.1 response regulator [Rhodospirillales bacterium]